jgi:hypothetical protein
MVGISTARSFKFFIDNSNATNPVCLMKYKAFSTDSKWLGIDGKENASGIPILRYDLSDNSTLILSLNLSEDVLTELSKPISLERFGKKWKSEISRLKENNSYYLNLSILTPFNVILLPFYEHDSTDSTISANIIAPRLHSLQKFEINKMLIWNINKELKTFAIGRIIALPTEQTLRVHQYTPKRSTRKGTEFLQDTSPSAVVELTITQQFHGIPFIFNQKNVIPKQIYDRLF